MTSRSTRACSAVAYVAAALLLAAVNIAPLAARLSDQLRHVTRLRVHLYDVGLFVLFGLLAALTVWLHSALTERLPRVSGRRYALLLTGLLGAVLGGALLAKDFANFAGKQDLPVAPVWLGVAAGLVTLLGVAWVRQHLRGNHVLLGLATVVALGLGYGNAEVLEGDYPGIHLFVAITALVLLAAPLRRWCFTRVAPAVIHALLATAVLAGCSLLLLPPSRIVRQNLSASSGSVLAPFVTPWLPQSLSIHAERLPVEKTEWFAPREQAAPIAPTPRSPLAPNGVVLLLTIEALRADVVESRKHDDVLPNLARLRDSSLRFTQARSPTPSTLTTVTSLLTGKYYSQIYFTEHEPGKVNPITDRSVRVPERLSRAGIRTVNARAVHGLGPNFGVGRGFDAAPKTAKDFGRARDLMELVLDELARIERNPERRLFLFAHFVDSHAPYTLGGKRATAFDSYLAEVELIDRELGRLLTYLEQHALGSRCLLVVSADHGEAFGEHGTRFHARNVYDELLRVPLLIHHPSLHPKAIDTPVTLLDLSPTFLDLFGLPSPGSFMGQSLVPLLLGQPAKLTRPIAADAGRRKQALLFANGIKVHRDLLTGAVQVFDLKRDPQELSDLTDDGTRDVEPYIGATERFFATHTLKVPGWKPPWRSF